MVAPSACSCRQPHGPDTGAEATLLELRLVATLFCEIRTRLGDIEVLLRDLGAAGEPTPLPPYLRDDCAGPATTCGCGKYEVTTS